MAVHEVAIGIDEVGRGALAGPVVVAAAMIQGGIGKTAFEKAGLGTLKDSKKLSAKKREAWYEYFVAAKSAPKPKIMFTIARVYPREIERRNISQAANLAAKRAFARLVRKLNSKQGVKKIILKSPAIFLDGGLYLGTREQQSTKFPNAKTIVKADEKIPAVSIASIIAKVHRDRFMVKLAKKYPQYGFEIHKGYGTKVHRAAIQKQGACEAHRLTFLGKSNTISK